MISGDNMAVKKTLKDWITTFWRVLVSPTSKTFIAESQKAKGKFSSAIGWMIFFAIYLFIFSTIAFKQVQVIGLIFVILAFPLALIILTYVMHFVYQRVFKRNKYLYDELLYINVAILLPIQFLFVPISIIIYPSLPTPTMGSILNYGIFLYQIALLVRAFTSITNLKYWQSIVTILISISISILVFLCTIPFFYSLIGGVNNTLR